MSFRGTKSLGAGLCRIREKSLKAGAGVTILAHSLRGGNYGEDSGRHGKRL